MKKKSIILLGSIFLTVALIESGLIGAALRLTHPEEIALGIMIIAAMLWVTEATALFVTSFIIVALEALWLIPAMDALGETARIESFLAPFFSNTTLLFLGGFTISSALNKYHIDQKLAKIMLRAPGEDPARILLAIIVVSAFLSMWMSNTATAAMVFTIAYPIIQSIPVGAPFAKGIALAIPFACNIGGIGTPIGTPPNAIAIALLKGHGVDVSFFDWMILAIPVELAALYILWRLMLRLYPAGDFKLTVKLDENSNGSISRDHIVIISVFLATALGWLTSDAHGIALGIVSLIPIIVFFGFNYLSANDFRTLSWHVLFMLGGGLSLGYALNVSGLTARVAELIPLGLGFWPLLALFLVIGAVVSTFISNTATANLILPVIVSLDQSPLTMTIAVAIALSGAMALPVSTPPNALAFGSGLISTRDMGLSGSMVTGVILALILVCALIVW